MNVKIAPNININTLGIVTKWGINSISFTSELNFWTVYFQWDCLDVFRMRERQGFFLSRVACHEWKEKVVPNMLPKVHFDSSLVTSDKATSDEWGIGMHTVSFDWYLSGLEWILNLEFCLLKLLIFYQKFYGESGLNSSTFWVFEPVFKYIWSKSSFFVHKASILFKPI